MIHRPSFFDQSRASLFNGKFSQGQVDGLNFILDAWEATHADKDIRWLAYALATAFHETDRTMQPIREKGGSDYFFRMYDPGSPRPERAAAAKAMKAQPGDGVLYFGRGYVQLTWRVNYERMGQTFGVQLTGSAAAADRALDPTLAAKIMFKGMEDGMFTGRKLATYFNPTTEDWVNARRIINGLDCADAIAGYGRHFHAALRAAPG